MAINSDVVLEQIKKKTISALTLVGELVTTEAKVRCPVDTGKLRDSIAYEVNESGLSVRIGTPTEYGPYVEFGTKTMRMQPFLRPAVLENRDKIEKVFAVVK